MGTFRIKVEISADGLEASVSVVPGPLVGRDELLAKLEEAGVVAGIDESVVRKVALGLADKEFNAPPTVIATAVAPRSGAPERMELAFSVGIQGSSQRSDGTLDFRHRGLLKPAASGQVIARVEPAVVPEAGQTVLGELIPALSARAAKLPKLGEGVAQRPDGAIIARRSGVIHYKPGQILDVLESYEHRGDVDLRTGHLESRGSLHIRGTVRRGFAAAGGKELTISGGVDGGYAFCRGMVTIKGGVSSTDASILSGAGDVKFKHGQGARVESAASIFVEADAVHCSLSAVSVAVGNRVHGGRLEAEQIISVLDAGSDDEVRTVLAAAIPLERPLECELGRFSIAAALEQAKRNRGVGTAATGGRSKVSEKERKRIEKEAQRRRDALAERKQRLMLDAVVEVKGTVYPGVTVMIGTARLRVMTALRGVRYRYDEEADTIRTEWIEAESATATG